MLKKREIDELYRKAAKHGYSLVTADAIIETINQKYDPDPQHRINGKNIRTYLEQRGWNYCGEINKIVNGNSTTVGLYINGAVV